jgi:hypothetical protein
MRLLVICLAILGTTWAGAEETGCPQFWATFYTPRGPVEIAEGLSGTCAAERFTETGYYVKVEASKKRVAVIAHAPSAAACSLAQPCLLVVGVRSEACVPAEPKVVYVDGQADVETRIRRVQAQPGGFPVCENETLVTGRIAAPRFAGAPRRFAATVDLK